MNPFVISSGRHNVIAGNELLCRKLGELNSHGKMLAAICGGLVHLGKAAFSRREIHQLSKLGMEGGFRGRDLRI